MPSIEDYANAIELRHNENLDTPEKVVRRAMAARLILRGSQGSVYRPLHEALVQAILQACPREKISIAMLVATFGAFIGQVIPIALNYLPEGPDAGLSKEDLAKAVAIAIGQSICLSIEIETAIMSVDAVEKVWEKRPPKS